MKPIRSLLTTEVIEDLASRSHLRYGQQMAEDGDVKITEENNYNVTAHVKHREGQGRTVNLMSTTKGLRWKCTCTSKKDLFCNHCVAVALTIAKV
jgi:uncharacterized Zn finger protein